MTTPIVFQLSSLGHGSNEVSCPLWVSLQLWHKTQLKLWRTLHGQPLSALHIEFRTTNSGKINWSAFLPSQSGHTHLLAESRLICKNYAIYRDCANIYKLSCKEGVVRYNPFVGHGDSSAFTHVVKLKTYRPDVKMTQDECHVQVVRRMGRSLKKY